MYTRALFYSENTIFKEESSSMDAARVYLL